VQSVAPPVVPASGVLRCRGLCTAVGDHHWLHYVLVVECDPYIVQTTATQNSLRASQAIIVTFTASGKVDLFASKHACNISI